MPPGANIILTARDPSRLQRAAIKVDAQRTVAFDANDPEALHSFFRDLQAPIDHVMLTAGARHYGLPLQMEWSPRRPCSASERSERRPGRRLRVQCCVRGGMAGATGSVREECSDMCAYIQKEARTRRETYGRNI
jgi:hypothetical protein